jgi:hypothetical protein
MSLRWISCTSVLFVLSGLAAADLDCPKDEGYFPGYYVGTVAGKAVQMALALDRYEKVKRLEGWCYYEVGGSPLSLSGKVQGPDLALVARDSTNNETGTIKIKLAFGEALDGSWTAGNKKSLPVALRRVATTTRVAEANRLTDCEARFPIFAGKSKAIIELNATIRKEAAGTLFKFEEMKAAANESDGVDAVPCVLSLRYLVRFWSPTLISLCVDKYTYAGGAHGNTDLKSLNYRLSDGEFREFALQDIIKDKGEAEKGLVKLVTGDLVRRQVGWFKTGSLIRPPTFSLKDFQVFTFHPAGLTIHFPPYEVACYADGCVLVRIPWEQLRNYLLSDGPLGKLSRAE